MQNPCVLSDLALTDETSCCSSGAAGCRGEHTCGVSRAEPGYSEVEREMFSLVLSSGCGGIGFVGEVGCFAEGERNKRGNLQLCRGAAPGRTLFVARPCEARARGRWEVRVARLWSFGCPGLRVGHFVTKIPVRVCSLSVTL